MTDLTYAVVGGPPRNWHDLFVVDLDTQKEISRAVEVNTTEGWLVRFKEGPDGRIQKDANGTGGPIKERVTGRFEIRRR